MNIRKWFTNLIFGKRDTKIEELEYEIQRVKKVKQKEIDKTNAYWKTKMYNQSQLTIRSLK